MQLSRIISKVKEQIQIFIYLESINLYKSKFVASNQDVHHNIEHANGINLNKNQSSIVLAVHLCISRQFKWNWPKLHCTGAT